jgi:hypothetical protein
MTQTLDPLSPEEFASLTEVSKAKHSRRFLSCIP